ncbi:MAG: gephyrin-like molybdotransferase Glp [Solirubrobacterales bacterium]
MISVETALERVLAGLQPAGLETVPLSQSLGRVLAVDLEARVAHPPVAVSAMDGYAVHGADLAQIPARLFVVGESAAGHPFAGTCGDGGAVRIFTGAAVPHGADTVVMQEDTERDGEFVVIKAPATVGRHIRHAGNDFAVGDCLLHAGIVMGPRQIGLAAAMNIPWVTVRRRPRIAVLSTGDEIAMPGEPLGPAHIVSSNGPALAALIEASGCEAVQLGIARDTRRSLSTMLEAAAGADLLVTSGGVSVGDYDIVADVMGEHGLKLDFWKIAIRPGKPLMFGRMKDTPVLGLPGNPVSALVTAYLFLLPMMRALQGLPAEIPTVSAILGADVAANGDRQDYQRASLERRADGALVATPFAKQDSAVLSGLAAAGCLLIRPPHAPAAAAGSPVTVLPLPEGM